jgi:hypothetical protein
MHDLGHQLVDIAQRDIEGMGTPATGRSARPETGWRCLYKCDEDGRCRCLSVEAGVLMGTDRDR